MGLNNAQKYAKFLKRKVPHFIFFHKSDETADSVYETHDLREKVPEKGRKQEPQSEDADNTGGDSAQRFCVSRNGAVDWTEITIVETRHGTSLQTDMYVPFCRDVIIWRLYLPCFLFLQSIS